MINVVDDIAKIMKYDKSHNVKITIEPSGATVFLFEAGFDYNIPIKYECSDGVYIDNDKQKGSIYVCEIDIVKNIMEYLEDHMNEIDELCNKCDWFGRQKEN